MKFPKELIDQDAEKVLRRLRRNGHEAYLVGGCVRDLLLGFVPKDFDVATSATPAETRRLFRNCRIIGRRFQLAHIFFGTKIIETATFRGNPRSEDDEDDELLIRHDNVFGTAEEDARRRDFTINGLFYDIEEHKVIDYVGGLDDLAARTVCTIGDPDVRFREDPIRMLRAIKFAARLNLKIGTETYAALLANVSELPKSAPPRLLEEFYRLLRGRAAKGSLRLMLDTGVARTMAPTLVKRYAGLTDEDFAWRLIAQLDLFLHNKRIDGEPHVGYRSRKPRTVGSNEDGGPLARPTNSLLLATLLMPFVDPVENLEERVGDTTDRIEKLLAPLVVQLGASRKDSERARQILLAQRRLSPSKKRRSRAMSLVKRDFFPEALVLFDMGLRARGVEKSEEVERWNALWRKNTGLRDGSAAPGPASPEEKRRPRRRKRGGRRRKRSSSAPADVSPVAEPSASDGRSDPDRG